MKIKCKNIDFKKKSCKYTLYYQFLLLKDVKDVTLLLKCRYLFQLNIENLYFRAFQVKINDGLNAYQNFKLFIKGGLKRIETT